MNLDNIRVRVDKDYPEIVDAVDCKKTVNIIKNLATSRHSELTAILQYTYEAVIADKFMDNIGGIIEEISIVEMMHLELLMHAIVDFGGQPKFEDSQGQIFNTSNINYTMKLKEMLDNNINAEMMAIEQYSHAIDMVSNASLKELFARIIEDEKRHIEVFKEIRDNVTFLSI